MSNVVIKIKKSTKDFLKSMYGWSVPPALRFGPDFREYSIFLAKSQFWSYEQLLEYQSKQLSKLVNHAYKYIPYYKDLFDKTGITPDDIKTVDDIKKIPFLTKIIMKENLEKMRSSAFEDQELTLCHTGGSTGVPTSFYRIKANFKAIEKAFNFRELSWAGIKYRDKSASFRGSVIIQDKRELWFESSLDNSIEFSSSDLTEENFSKICDKLLQFKPKVIKAFPSAVFLLAKVIKDSRYKNQIKPEAIFTSSETLYIYQREFIEGVFGCKIFDRYGHSERAVAAMECNEHNGYHSEMDYGILEIVDNNDKTILEEGMSGEIIGTGLHNFAMPLIRFKTGDMAVYSAKKCSCGLNFPLIKKIEGRIQDFIIAKNNRLISISDMNLHSDVFKNVKEFQIQQFEIGKVILNIKKMSNYNIEDSSNIINAIKNNVGWDLDIEIKFMDNILTTTANGKKPLFVQHLEHDRYCLY